MGFVEKTMASFSPVGGNEVYEPLSLKDWMWTWILQSGINDTDLSWALHGKTMCLMEAGRHEEALKNR